jgi:3',5'-cyclic AMP phosphodiesterase CpdA
MTNHKLILHLSDLHFGPHSRFTDQDPFDLGKISAMDVLAEIRRLKDKGTLHSEASVNLIIVTGDIAETARPAEYKLALTFFQALLKEFRINTDQLVIIPGNHDVSWAECRKAEIDFDTYAWDEQRLREEMNKVKFMHFDSFLTQLYGKPQSLLKHVSELGDNGRLFDFPEFNLSVAALNSCEKESHRLGDHIGCLYKRQAEMIWNAWQDSCQSSRVRIICVHHNPLPTVIDEIEKLRDELQELLKNNILTEDELTRFVTDTVGLQGADMLRDVAERSHVQLLLHGHHHASDHAGSWSWTGGQVGMCHVLSAGAWGASVTPNSRPAVIQLLELDTEKSPSEGGIRSFLFEYKPYERAQRRIGAGLWTLSSREKTLPLWMCSDTKSESLHQRRFSSPSDQRKLTETNGGIETIRVSMAALLRLDNDNKYLLVRSNHRPELFAPFGGVFKYRLEAITSLKDIGFVSEHCALNKRVDLEQDLDRDLRGYIARENLELFISWFNLQINREVSVDCLQRELCEELNQAKVPSNLIESASEYTFRHIRTVQDGPKPTPWGYDIFRHFEIYEPDYNDQNHGTRNRQITLDLFNSADDHHSDLLVVDLPAMHRLRANRGETLAVTVDYFFSATKREHEPTPFGHLEYSSVAERQVEDFLMNKSSKLFGECKTIGIPVLLHSVRKYYSESVVFRVSFDGIPYIIKYYPDHNIYVRKEKWALETLNLHGVPVPKLLEAYEQAPAYTIMEFLTGQRLSDCPDSEILKHVTGVVKLTSKLRDVKLDQYGEIIGEFIPVGNHRELIHYVQSSVTYWQKELGEHLKPTHRSSVGISQLLNWADRILGRNNKAQINLRSALSNEPCLCHSDIKLTDVIVKNISGQLKYFLLDFDNVFAFVPEFDLCKFHFSTFEHGVQIDLNMYADMIATHYEINHNNALDGLISVYPFVLMRLLSWASKRDHEPLIAKIDQMMQLVQ